MKKWPMDLMPVQPGYYAPDVQQYCVRDAMWQEFRKKMKGVPTEQKLDMLKEWWSKNLHAPGRTEVQVGNYLGALRRGGQLNMNNEVVR